MKYYYFPNIIRHIFTALNIYLIYNIFSQILLNINSYNWDNSENMYFSSRILHGEFVYIREFYDKFFLVPLLFIIFSYYKSVNSWVAVNVIISLLASGALSATIVEIFRYYSNTNVAKSIKIFISFFYLYLMSCIQGEFIYVNPMAASFYIFFIYFIIKSEKRDQYKILVSNYWFIMAALCSSIAISIRPYYLLSVLFTVFWRILYYKLIFMCNYQFSFLSFRTNFSRFFSTYIYFLFLLFIFFSILNIFPYVIINAFNSLFIGTRMLLLELKPTIYMETISNQLLYFNNLNIIIYVYLVISIFMLVIFIFFNRYMSQIFNVKYENNVIMVIDLISMSLVPIFLLEIMILSKHYWPHYMQLFIPNLVMFCGIILCFAVRINIFYFIEDLFSVFLRWFRNYYTRITSMHIVNNTYYILNIKKLIKLIIYFSPVLLIFIEEHSTHKMYLNIERIRNNKAEYILLNTIEEIRNKRRNIGFGDDFLYTSNMFSHWMLDESRHGFPHASHFSAISQGWFSNWNPRSVMPGFPTTTDNLCRKINLSGPSIVFVPKNSALFECMSLRSPIIYSLHGIFVDYDGPVAVMFRDVVQ